MHRPRRLLAPPLFGLTSLAMIAVSVARAAAPAPTPPPPPRLFGAWTVNQQLTAELAQRERETASGGPRGGWGGHGGGPPGGGGPGGGGSGGGGGRHHGGGFGGGDDGGRGEEGGRGLGSNVIFSSAADGAVVLTDGAGHERRFAPGAAATRDPQSPDKAEVRASWDADGDLVVEIKPEKGPRRTETYIVDHEKKHLYVTTVITSGFGSHTRTVAFDPVDPTTLPPPGAPSTEG